MPKRDKKSSEKPDNDIESGMPERELMLAQVQETAVASSDDTLTTAAFARMRFRPIDKNGFAIPKPDRRWLH